MVKVAVVKKMDNGDVEYKVLNDMDTDMRWLKWSIIFMFVAVLCPFFLKNIGVISVYIVAGLLAAIGIGIFVCLALRSHSLGVSLSKRVMSVG